jgi:putative sugar O-methyltransferase
MVNFFKKNKNMLAKIKGIFIGFLWKCLNLVGLTPKFIATISGKTKISNDDIQLLESMKADNQKSVTPYKSTEIWTDLGNMFENWFYWEGIEKVEQQKMNGFFSNPIPRDPKLLRYACWLLYQNIKSRDILGILDKVEAGSDVTSGLCFEFDGKKISWDILISLDTLYSIYDIDKSIFTEPVLVVDIGAGWGRIGYVLLLANPKAKYVILDLPQVLIVSSKYLPKRLSRKSFLTYDKSRAFTNFNKEALSDYQGAFLGTFDFDKFDDKSIDFIINVASFQEMTPEQVSLYFNKIDQKLSGLFYTQQLWTSTTHAINLGEISGYDDFPFKPHWSKKILKNATWSDLYFEIIFEVD